MRTESIPRACLLIAVAVGPVIARAVPPTGGEPVASDEQVAKLIDQLGATSFEVRTAATQRLLAMGPRATTLLRAAERSDDFETVVRARQLLHVLDDLLFAGVTIEIQASRTNIRWTDSIELIVKLHNPTPHAARIPFESEPPSPGAAPSYVYQVATSLDLADFLEVVTPDGQTLELHVDDITQDDRVRAAVDDRVERPRTSDLPPGATFVLHVPEWNRGWARYRLLRRGVHAIRLVYQPQWSDEKMIRAGVGRVSSNVVHITVTEPAPSAVRATSSNASLHLERAGRHIAAYLTNHSDFPLYVNLNIAEREPAPFARLRWFQSCGDTRTEIQPPAAPQGSIAVFQREGVKKIDAGGNVELGRIKTSILATSTDGTNECDVSVSYSNLAGRTWQRIQAAGLLGNPNAPEALRTLLPRRMLVTTLTSPALTPLPSE